MLRYVAARRPASLRTLRRRSRAHSSGRSRASFHFPRREFDTRASPANTGEKFKPHRSCRCDRASGSTHSNPAPCGRALGVHPDWRHRSAAPRRRTRVSGVCSPRGLAILLRSPEEVLESAVWPSKDAEAEPEDDLFGLFISSCSPSARRGEVSIVWARASTPAQLARRSPAWPGPSTCSRFGLSFGGLPRTRLRDGALGVARSRATQTQ